MSIMERIELPVGSLVEAVQIDRRIRRYLYAGFGCWIDQDGSVFENIVWRDHIIDWCVQYSTGIRVIK